MGQWIKDLAAAHHAFAETLAERQSMRVPSADPGHGDLCQAFPPWPGPARDAILRVAARWTAKGQRQSAAWVYRPLWREAMAVIALRVPGMTCRRCVRIVTARLRDLPGVVTVAADAATEEVVVHGEVS
jgi:hypothetical protein